MQSHTSPSLRLKAFDKVFGGQVAAEKRRGHARATKHGRLLAVVALLCGSAAFAQSVFTAPETAVGKTSAPSTATVTFAVTGTLGSIGVVTQGSPNLDFNSVAGGTCTVGMAYTIGQTCTVQFSFAPTAPGRRLGGVVLEDDSPTPVVLGDSYLNGIGDAPIAVFQTNGIVSYPITGLDNAQGLGFDGAGNYYIGGGSSETVIKYSPQGLQIGTLGSGYDFPTGVVVDGPGNVIVANEEGHEIEVLPVGGGPQQVLAGGLGYPYPLTVDQEGNVYTGEIGSGGPTTAHVVEITPAGVVTDLVTEALPVGDALDLAGNLYYADYISGTLQETTPGSGTAVRLNTGIGLNNPYGVAVDPAGHIYVGVYESSTSGQLLEVPSGGGNAVTVINTAAQTNYLTLGPLGQLYFGDKPNNRLGMVDRTAATLTFTATPIGSSSVQQVITFENDGNTTLPVDSIAETGPFNLSGAGTTCTASPLLSGANCGFGIVFAPTAEGNTSGTVTITDESLNMLGTTQTITITGVGGPKLITFPQPATPVGVNTTATLTATTSNGDPVVYSIVSGTASLSGAQITYTTQGSVTIEADSPSVNGNTAAVPVQRTVQVELASTITWEPATLTQLEGTPIGASVLDATASTPGTFVYTATDANQQNVVIDATTVLTGGVYTITATFTPSTAGYAPATATIQYTVVAQEVFVVNPGGSVTSYYDTGAIESNQVAGGGIGAAVDATGNFWSIDIGAASVTRFTNTGMMAADFSGADIAGASALAIDGNGTVWIANPNSISALTSAGVAVSATPMAQAGRIDTPASISVSESGSLWLANTGNNTVTEVIGVAAPVITPTVEQVIQSAPATRP